jgi:hypothetical protein
MEEVVALCRVAHCQHIVSYMSRFCYMHWWSLGENIRERMVDCPDALEPLTGIALGIIDAYEGRATNIFGKKKGPVERREILSTGPK